MVACLPKLFNVIHYLIQSIRRWVITREELVHKIIAGHSDITDRSKPLHSASQYIFPYKVFSKMSLTIFATLFAGEVEEQLVLMQELVPEWISQKRSPSGDLLVW